MQYLLPKRNGVQSKDINISKTHSTWEFRYNYVPQYMYWDTSFMNAVSSEKTISCQSGCDCVFWLCFFPSLLPVWPPPLPCRLCISVSVDPFCRLFFSTPDSHLPHYLEYINSLLPTVWCQIVVCTYPVILLYATLIFYFLVIHTLSSHKPTFSLGYLLRFPDWVFIRVLQTSLLST